MSSSIEKQIGHSKAVFSKNFAGGLGIPFRRPCPSFVVVDANEVAELPDASESYSSCGTGSSKTLSTLVDRVEEVIFDLAFDRVASAISRAPVSFALSLKYNNRSLLCALPLPNLLQSQPGVVGYVSRTCWMSFKCGTGVIV